MYHKYLLASSLSPPISPPWPLRPRYAVIPCPTFRSQQPEQAFTPKPQSFSALRTKELTVVHCTLPHHSCSSPLFPSLPRGWLFRHVLSGLSFLVSFFYLHPCSLLLSTYQRGMLELSPSPLFGVFRPPPSQVTGQGRQARIRQSFLT